MKLLVLPDDGLTPIVAALKKARSSIDTTVFRFDRPEIEKALEQAVARGVRVRALIAHTNHGGEKRLRKLEQRLLGAGVTVARSGDDLVRYHGKMLIIDNRVLHVMLFNYTALDAKSRSFGVTTKTRAQVQEAIRLFEADMTRTPLVSAKPALVISPENARKTLAGLIKASKRELCIYDPEVSDRAMLKLLEERAAKGVSIRVIGKLGKYAGPLRAERLPKGRLHARVIISDGRHAFLGSQGLRRAELDARREIGVIVRDPKLLKTLRDVFESDWAETPTAQASSKNAAATPDAKPADKIEEAPAVVAS